MILSYVGNRLRKTITALEESLAEKTSEAEHLTQLVAKMESTPGQDEMNKVQIADLKEELRKAEENLKTRLEELLQTKKDLRLKDETIQQREIEISCLRGQVMLSDEADDDSDNTLTAVGDSDGASDDVLLEDLEWDTCDVMKTPETDNDQ